MPHGPLLVDHVQKAGKGFVRNKTRLNPLAHGELSAELTCQVNFAQLMPISLRRVDSYISFRIIHLYRRVQTRVQTARRRVRGARALGMPR